MTEERNCSTCAYLNQDRGTCRQDSCWENSGYAKWQSRNQPDNVNHPSHYTSGNIECIDAIESATEHLKGIEALCTGNAIKYLWRWKFKGGVEDLKKARWYIDKLISRQEGGQ